ncbi:MAG: peptide/nickel transport system ATP-binding protein [Alphaproteobacteria bacterium]|jgi:peptide/nickel transport system ATP-binding protein
MSAAEDVTHIPALEVADLKVSFPTRAGQIHAVAGISYQIAAGRTLGIVGESGSGKSVTALAIMGLVPLPGRVTGGTIRIGGDDVTGLDDSALSRIRGERVAMAFQEPMTALNPVLTIGSQVAEAWALHRHAGKAEAREAALNMLERVRIPEPTRRYDAYPHQMSGGMSQRAMIAMALTCRPEVLIADEPTTALDVTIQAQIIELMAEIQAEFGMAIQFISHNLGVVSEIADDVAVMYAGHIVEQASAANIFANPRHPYTRALIDTVPRIGARNRRLPAIGGQVPHPLALPPGCPFSDRCPLADADCRATIPVLEDKGNGHLVACFKTERGS